MDFGAYMAESIRNIMAKAYLKFGHTKQMVEAVKDIVGAEPKTVSEPLAEPVDVLFLGAGVMLGKVDGSVVRFINTLTPDKVKCVETNTNCTN